MLQAIITRTHVELDLCNAGGAWAVFDVAVGVRKASVMLGQWVGVELSEDNHRQFWVQPGFAHGFVILRERADFFYKTTDYYAPEYERSIAWNDPVIGIEWSVLEMSGLWVKDKRGLALGEAELLLGKTQP